jgi:hypothetical protein
VKLWACPNAGRGILGATDCAAVRAPLRMPPDDVRRFCLACSAKSGRLVRRVCPSHELKLERRRRHKKEGLTPSMLSALHTYFRLPGDERFGRGPEVTKRVRVGLHAHGIITHPFKPGLHQLDAELTPKGQEVLRALYASSPLLAAQVLADKAKPRAGDDARLEAWRPVFGANGAELLTAGERKEVPPLP